MYDMTLAVDHDITVVPVFDLQDVAGNRVRRHRLDEVQPRSLERDGVLAAVLGDEEVEQVVDLGAAHFVARGRVRDYVDDAAL